MQNNPIHIISLGAGVQSSTMALMAKHGDITPMPGAAIFADTQAEPPSVYAWLEKELPFPVYRVTAGSLEAAVLKPHFSKKGRRFCDVDIPLHTLSAAGVKGMVKNRGCTRDFKIRPILKKVRELAAIKRGQKEVSVIQWIGISWDERLRGKESRDKWCEHRFPLIDLRFSRRHCVEWMEKKGYPTPPRSACIFCPFRSNKDWQVLKIEEPLSFQKAAQFEKEVCANFKSTPFLHNACKPLDEIDFRSEEDKGQGNLFINECEGMCGV